MNDIKFCKKCDREVDDLKFNNCKRCRMLATERSRKLYIRARDKVFSAYGGYKCNCPGCEIIEPTMLTIDHINNDGNKEPDYGTVFYKRLIKTGFPPGLQVLCANCNTSKMRNKGQCAHLGIVERDKFIPEYEEIKDSGPKVGTTYTDSCNVCGEPRLKNFKHARCEKHKWLRSAEAKRERCKIELEKEVKI